MGGGIFRFWFLRSLYELILIGLLYEFINHRFKLGLLSAVVYYLGALIILRIGFKYINGTVLDDFLDFESIIGYNYIGFTFGYLCRKQEKLLKCFDANITYSICIVLFSTILALHFYFDKNVVINKIMFLLPITAIICCRYIAKNRIRQGTLISGCLNYLGKYTLEIYIIHMFFNFRIFILGEYAMSLVHSSNYRDVFWGHTCMLVSSMVIAAIIIILSLLTMQVIKTSNILSIILLGRKNDN